MSYCFIIEGQAKKCQAHTTEMHLRMETVEGIATGRKVSVTCSGKDSHRCISQLICKEFLGLLPESLQTASCKLSLYMNLRTLCSGAAI